ncbi:haloacid dehalogenase type II [Saccharopolyspora sp. K220]|uniref:haloacid dehalogenase type II n=1 Tax=Saccharopolyspora soli TaxID=2926618 RepID=UPI001F587DD7|nr:haloacid dehalogenase type II [Saccharopolyspora soli]MCI2423194.1 haloacid dehalogenase type II [Saccharopolyspora soli]
MTKVIAFDVNETLLDLSVLDEPFERLFGTAGLRPQWFSLALQLLFVGGLTDSYVDFSTAQHAALQMLARRENVALTDDAARETVALMSSLPPHPEVADALGKLMSSPLRVVALTNSVEPVAEAQLRHAGIHNHFHRVISADSVRRLKPAPEPYREVARMFGVALGDVRLVAAHSWDVTGALRAGCKAAFVARPGMVPSPIGPQPDIVASDIADAVDRILAVDVPS